METFSLWLSVETAMREESVKRLNPKARWHHLDILRALRKDVDLVTDMSRSEIRSQIFPSDHSASRIYLQNDSALSTVIFH